MLSETSTIIFPGTNYNTVIAIMPDYLCNILLQGSEDLNENKKKSLTAYLNLSMTLGVSITMRLPYTTKAYKTALI